MELKPRKLTWRPQQVKGGSLRDIQKYLRNNPGLTTYKVPPAVMAALLTEYHASNIVPIFSAPGCFNIVISGVRIEVGK